MKTPRPTELARELPVFFSEHLPLLRGLSTPTVHSYRDAFVLLLRFLATHPGCQVVALDLVHVTPEHLMAFLLHLETEPHNGTSTRNARLAAVHSFVRCVATRHPEPLALCQRLLAVPIKRGSTRVVEYLEAHELRALLDGIDRGTSNGRRDHALLVTLFNTAARVQEILAVRPADLQLERPLQVRLRGKGRQERIGPLWPQTADVWRGVLGESGLEQHSAERLFRNARGEPLTRFGVRYLLRKYARLGHASAPSLARKRVHPHTVRHRAAVHMLQAGVDLVSICHWLGHASVETTNRYTAVELETKRAALAQAGPVVEETETQLTWRADESILAWLESL